MPPTLTFTLIVAPEVALLAYLAIPYAWERFIAFGQARFDTHFGGYGASTGAGEGIAAEARITGLVAHHDGSGL